MDSKNTSAEIFQILAEIWAEQNGLKIISIDGENVNENINS